MKLNSRISEDMDFHTVFAEINKRQIAAIMLHRELAVMFSFLGLQGFKRWQEYRCKEESDENIKLNYYCIDYNNYMIEQLPVEAVKIVPSDWYKAKRLEVTTNIKKSYTNRIFMEWQEWEKETKEVYEKYYKHLMDSGRTCDAEKVMCLLKSTSKELKKMERVFEDLKLVDFDSVYIAEIQKKIHDKYKKKMHME